MKGNWVGTQILHLVAVCALACPAAASGAYYNIDIAAGSAEDAIAAFSQQTHRLIVAPGEALAGVKTSAVHGVFTASAALALLFKDAGLDVLSDDGTTILLRRQSLRQPAGQETKVFSERAAPPEVVTVTGYRASLLSAATVKREAVNFSDSVFAEDIGKFPDLNLAEAINRVPGVRLNRDPSGEGTQIVVRGLGPSFTLVLMNGHPIEVATDGMTGAGVSNRETDLDMFPVELFTKIIVSKTPVANIYEGGIAGTVDIHTSRPLDNPEPGFHLTYSLQTAYNSVNGALSPRGAIIASQNWDNKVGILFGVALQHYQFRVDGYENIGNALADVASQQSGCAQCNVIGTGKNFRWASVVPQGVTANAALGIGAVGTPYNYSGGIDTPGGTSGLSATALSNVIFPYLARESTKFGDRNRSSALLSVQYRPTANIEVGFAGLYEYSQRLYATNDMDWFVRNSCNAAGTAANCMVPVKVTADAKGYLTSGTFLNATFFAEPTDFRENIQFLDFNPTLDWTVKPWLNVHGAVDYNESSMNRREWSFHFQTRPGAGYSLQYEMKPGQDFPTLTTTAPLSDPNDPNWVWYRLGIQPLYRDTLGKSANWEATFGRDAANLKIGYDFYQYYRFINARDITTNATNCIIGPSTAAAPCVLPDGTTTPAGTQLVPPSELAKYISFNPISNFLGLSDGSQGFGNYLTLSPALADVTNIRGFVAAAPFSPTGAVGAQKSGKVNEQTQNAYIAANATFKVLERDVHVNAGLRYYKTDQKITGPVNVNGTYVMFDNDRRREGLLPSLNVSADIHDSVVLRIASSQTMTRANPSAMLPSIAFGSALLSPVSAGNPNLKPYFSTNIDIGLEWYMDGPGVVAINVFRKEIKNFTVSQQVLEPFSATGIPVSVLSTTQMVDYSSNGGPNEIVAVNTTVNLSQKLYLEGCELQVALPLDRVIEGAGLTGTYTRIGSHVSSGLTAIEAKGLATGVAPYTFNFGAYYENKDESIHMTYNVVGRFISEATPSSQGIMYPQYTESFGQLDLAASFTPSWFRGTVLERAQVTLNALNLLNARARAFDGDTNSPNFVWYPGTSFIVGLRGVL